MGGVEHVRGYQPMRWPKKITTATRCLFNSKGCAYSNQAFPGVARGGAFLRQTLVLDSCRRFACCRGNFLQRPKPSPSRACKVEQGDLPHIASVCRLQTVGTLARVVLHLVNECCSIEGDKHGYRYRYQ